MNFYLLADTQSLLASLRVHQSRFQCLLARAKVILRFCAGVNGIFDPRAETVGLRAGHVQNDLFRPDRQGDAVARNRGACAGRHFRHQSADAGLCEDQRAFTRFEGGLEQIA